MSSWLWRGRAQLCPHYPVSFTTGQSLEKGSARWPWLWEWLGTFSFWSSVLLLLRGDTEKYPLPTLMETSASVLSPTPQLRHL